ncbi:head decoration protein [Paenibacillus sp. NRS-1760]|uniref:head decoration protein n=1 Tax=Paenibacillus sp. NRS-1760 TaxID=3233902 RepID=UPI003D2DAA0B
MPKNLVSSTSNEYDDLFVGGSFPVVVDTVTLKSGAAYKRGTVLGLITTGGLAVAVDSTKSDGSQKAYAVLADDVDATLANTVATGYFTGEFNAAALSFGGTDTIATHKTALRALSIFAKAVQG